MSNNDKKWVAIMILFVAFGYVLGIFIKHILAGVVTSAVGIKLLGFVAPGFMLVFAFIFLYIYQKNKGE